MVACIGLKWKYGVIFVVKMSGRAKQGRPDMALSALQIQLSDDKSSQLLNEMDSEKNHFYIFV